MLHVADPLTELEAEVRAAGHQLEREWADQGVATSHGAGWRIIIDGEVVAIGGSIAAVREHLRRWWEGRAL